MKGTIKLLNVGDGDAILIHLNRNSEDLVIVLDAGQPLHYQEIVKPALKKLLIKTNKTSPDIVIATHFDSDHIGGLIPLIKDYIDGISEVWVLKSPELNFSDNQILKTSKGRLKIKSLAQHIFESQMIKEHSSINEEEIREKSVFLIESLRQLNTFLGLIPTEKVREVYHGYSFPNWPELKVLGPTKLYYNTLFPKNKSLKEYIIEETVDYINESMSNTRKRNVELASYLLYKHYKCS